MLCNRSNWLSVNPSYRATLFIGQLQAIPSSTDDLERPLHGPTRTVQTIGNLQVRVAFQSQSNDFLQTWILKPQEQGLARLHKLGGKFRSRFTRFKEIDRVHALIAAATDENVTRQISTQITLLPLIELMPCALFVT